MTGATNPLLPIDPDAVPVRVVDRISIQAVVGGLIGLTLDTNRGGIDEEGNYRDEFIVAARLRLNVDLARALREALDAHIHLLSLPSSRAN